MRILWLVLLLLSANAGLAQSLPDVTNLKDVEYVWAHIKYQVSGEDKQAQAFAQLSQHVANMRRNSADSPELKVWHAVILATKASFEGSLDALKDAEQAKALLEELEHGAPHVLRGAALITLGMLYHKVPGWPFGFGDDVRAEIYLRKALELDPHGRDANYFLADYEFDRGDYPLARKHLEKALSASAPSTLEIANKGRLEEMKALQAKLGDR